MGNDRMNWSGPGRLRPVGQLAGVLAIVVGMSLWVQVRTEPETRLPQPHVAAEKPPEPVPQVVVQPAVPRPAVAAIDKVQVPETMSPPAVAPGLDKAAVA